jgi:hypothetical protein
MTRTQLVVVCPIAQVCCSWRNKHGPLIHSSQTFLARQPVAGLFIRRKGQSQGFGGRFWCSENGMGDWTSTLLLLISSGRLSPNNGYTIDHAQPWLRLPFRFQGMYILGLGAVSCFAKGLPAPRSDWDNVSPRLVCHSMACSPLILDDNPVIPTLHPPVSSTETVGLENTHRGLRLERE